MRIPDKTASFFCFFELVKKEAATTADTTQLRPPRSEHGALVTQRITPRGLF